MLDDGFYRFIVDNEDKIRQIFKDMDRNTSSFNMTLFGWKTLYRSYLLRTHEGVMERVSHMWFRVALFLHRGNWDKVCESFSRLKRGDFIHATPTLYHAGCINPQMASCFIDNTPVMTKKGYKPIQNVSIGDFVLTHDHSWKRVIQLHTNPLRGRRLFEVETYHESQKPITCTEDHEFLVYNRSIDSTEWKSVSDLTGNDYILINHRLDAPKGLHEILIVKGIMCGSYLHDGELYKQDDIVIRGDKMDEMKKIFTRLRICDSFQVIGYTSEKHFFVRLLNLSPRMSEIGVIENEIIYNGLLKMNRSCFKVVLQGLKYTGIIDDNNVISLFDFVKLQLFSTILDIHDIPYVFKDKYKIALKTQSFCEKISARYNRVHHDGQRFVRFRSRRLSNLQNVSVHTLGVEMNHSYFVGQLCAKNCFLIGTEDSVKGIFRTISHAAMISKHAGGLGIHVSNIRGKNSYIYGTNGFSNGIMPMLKVYNDTSRYIDQCFEGTTGIITSKGIFPIDTLQEGDEVLTEDGSYKKITQKLIYPSYGKTFCSFSRDVLGRNCRSLITCEHTMFLEKDGARSYTELYKAPMGSLSVMIDPSPTTDVPFTANECYIMGQIFGHCQLSGLTIVVSSSFVPMMMNDPVITNLCMRIGVSVKMIDNRLIAAIAPTILTQSPLEIDVKTFGTNSLPTKWLHIPFPKLEALVRGLRETSMWGCESFDPQRKFCEYRIQAHTHTSMDLSPQRHDIINVYPWVYDLCVDTNRNYQTVFGLAHNGGGKRNGAFAIYLEPWHSDIYEFLFARRNIGNEEERARDLFYGLWIPDLFMRRVETNGDWCLMCPNECVGLDTSYGEEFDTIYESYEREGRFLKKVRARDLWGEIIKSQIETGVPYMLYKDACNNRSNHKNLGRSRGICGLQSRIDISTPNGR
ncbi:MAG: hypothetical protein EBV19_04390 [Flavobacteriia bacterium]|nr:hypothetical protein [Flavobacteriia bacterium]